MTNGYQRKPGAASKRNGFTRLGSTIQGESGTTANQGAPKGIFSTGDEICVRGYRSLYAYVSQHGKWYNRGAISPCVGAQRNVWRDARHLMSIDTWMAGGYVVYIANAQRQVDAANNYEYSIIFRATTADEQVVIDNATLSGPSAGSATGVTLGPVHATADASRAILMWQNGNGGTTLTIYEWLFSTPTAAPTLQTTKNDLYIHATKQGRRSYDCCSVPSSGYWAYCYIENTAQNIKVFVMNGSTQIATATLTTGHTHEVCGIAYGATSGQLYIIAATDSNPYQVEAWALNPASLATIVGPVVVDGYTINERVESVGIVEGAVGGATRVACVWHKTATSGFNQSSLENRTFTTALASPDAKHTIYNCYPISKPWVERGRCYVAMHTCVGTENTQVGGASVVDLMSYDILGTDRGHHLASAYNCGLCGGDNDDAWRGSLNQVYQVAGGQAIYRYADTVVGYKLTNTGSRFVGEEVEWDFTQYPVNQVVTRGAAAIGGGLISWYAGVLTEELGFYQGPVISGTASSHQVMVGTLAHGATYTYQAHHETYDERGNLLRSIPGPTVSVTTGAGADDYAIDLTIDSPGATSRYGRRNFGVVVYRADADGVFNRVCEPRRTQSARSGNFYFETFRDLGTVKGTTIYTQGGAEVEAAGPDGASIICTSSQRVWLAGFGRRDRVQYSKLYNPGSASEDAIAPEYNGTFTFIIPRGKRCTGLAELDDKTIVFTADEVYAIAGNGPDDGGRGSDFSGLTPITTDTGCIEPRSVIALPGGVMFQARAGLYLLGRDLQVTFLGQPVKDDTDVFMEITSAVLVPKVNQVRFTARKGSNATSIILVYDYNTQAWSRWEPKKSGGALLDTVGACMHGDVYYVLESDGNVWAEDPSTFKDDGSVYVPLTIMWSWLQGEGQSTWSRVRQVVALCAKRDNHDLLIEFYQDFEAAPSATKTWPESEINAQPNPDVREQMIARIARQKCTAFRVKLYDQASAGTTSGEGFNCAGLMVELGGKRGLVKAGTQQRN